MQIWYNGDNKYNDTTPATARSRSNNDGIYFGASEDNSTSADLVDYSLVAWVDGEWTDQQIIEWSRDPFAMLRPRGRALRIAATQATTAVTGTLAGTLPVVTAELTGTETYTGTIEATLSPVTAALDGLVVVPVEGTIEGTLPAVTAALIGDGGASLDAWGPVYARGYYDRLKRRRKKKREELEALRAELRILLGLDPVPAGAGPDLEPLPEAPALPPFALVELDQAPLRQQVAILMEALKERETALKAAFDDDEAAILALMEAA
jgi:hypothetical protein